MRAEHNKGFTLLEVLVALAIVAFALTATIKVTGEAAANASYLQNKTLAHWVALNQLAELHVMQRWPSPGSRSTGEDEMAGQVWQWEREVIATDVADIRRVEISVSLGEERGEATPLTTLTGYLSQPNLRRSRQ